MELDFWLKPENWEFAKGELKLAGIDKPPIPVGIITRGHPHMKTGKKYKKATLVEAFLHIHFMESKGSWTGEHATAASTLLVEYLGDNYWDWKFSRLNEMIETRSK